MCLFKRKKDYLHVHNGRIKMKDTKLLIVTGMSGVGKSTTAQDLSSDD